MPKLDDADRRLIRALQQNARMSNLELAAKVGLSPSPCLRRVRLLEEAGVIERYVAIVNGEKAGVGLVVLARVQFTTQSTDTTLQFLETIRRYPEVTECFLTTGECDAVLKIVTADLHEYWRFQANRLTSIETVKEVKTDVVMEVGKQSFELPI